MRTLFRTIALFVALCMVFAFAPLSGDALAKGKRGKGAAGAKERPGKKNRGAKKGHKGGKGAKKDAKKGAKKEGKGKRGGKKGGRKGRGAPAVPNA